MLSLTPRNVWKNGHVEMGIQGFTQFCGFFPTARMGRFADFHAEEKSYKKRTTKPGMMEIVEIWKQ